MSQSHQSPGGQTLGQREFQGDMAIGISRQLGIEESRLVEVLTQLYLLGGSIGFCGRILRRTLINRHLGIQHHCFLQHPRFLQYHHVAFIDRATGEATEAMPVGQREDVPVEMAERQGMDIGRPPIP